jgi:hypothetical protein
MGRRATADVAEAWRDRIARQQRSGKSIAAFCGEAGVSTASFYQWRRRLANEDRAGGEGATFVELALPTTSWGRTGVRIELPGGAVATLPHDASCELVAAAIQAAMREGTSC